MKWLTKSIPFFTGIVIGFCLNGLFFKVFSYNQAIVHIKPELNVAELSMVVLTIIIAFYVPFMVSRTVDRDKKVKEILCDDIYSIISSLDDIEGIILECKPDGNVVSAGKYRIIEGQTTIIDNKINSLDNQISKVYRTQKSLVDETKIAYSKYWAFALKDPMGKLTVTSSYFKVFEANNKELVDSLKQLIHNINNI